MKKYLFIAAILLWGIKPSHAQETIEVTDQTLKIGGLKEEELYFGFAEGDKLIFNFREIDKKELKEIEIVEYPNTSKFSDFKTERVENKVIQINHQSVYIFKFKNGAVAGRICKINIQRIPANSATRNFNTAVTWVMKQDTTWNTFTKDVIVGYDSSTVIKMKRELIKVEQSEELVMDKSERVHSQTSGNRSFVYFTLPQSGRSGNTEKTVLAWAYWVGVGEESNQAYKRNAQVVSALAKGVANIYTSPLGALAVGAVADLAIPTKGEIVNYSITGEEDKNLFMAGYQWQAYDHGSGTAGFKKFLEPSLCHGTYYVCLSNNNILMAIDVNVKVIAIIETKTYEERPVTEIITAPRYEKKVIKEPVITSNRVPVTG